MGTEGLTERSWSPSDGAAMLLDRVASWGPGITPGPQEWAPRLEGGGRSPRRRVTGGMRPHVHSNLVCAPKTLGTGRRVGPGREAH